MARTIEGQGWAMLTVGGDGPDRVDPHVFPSKDELSAWVEYEDLYGLTWGERKREYGEQRVKVRIIAEVPEEAK